MSDTYDHVTNVRDVEEIDNTAGAHWGGFDRPLTPFMRPKGGKLGVSHLRLPPGRTVCPFHSHQLEDEVFFVLSGKGILRYGDDVREICAGDCVSCPAGTGIAHQIANPFEEDLVYLAIGPHEPNEVAVYPDSGKILVRSLKRVGYLEATEYLRGELEVPKIFALAASLPQGAPRPDATHGDGTA
ncbi:MAG: cupin domain-containing protein [Deltaproteobacteria bacterium]